MIRAEVKGMDKLHRNIQSAPKIYRKAMQQALSTTRRDSKPEATRIAQGIYTAGRNAIREGITTEKLDRQRLSFVMTAKRGGISLVNFKHRATKRGGVTVQVLRAGVMSKPIPAGFKKRGTKTGKMRILQRVLGGSKHVGRLPIVALASSSVASMFKRKEVFDRLNNFGTKKMSSELQRQIARAFPRG